jgi:hypothetical protein
MKQKNTTNATFAVVATRMNFSGLFGLCWWVFLPKYLKAHVWKLRWRDFLLPLHFFVYNGA